MGAVAGAQAHVEINHVFEFFALGFVDAVVLFDDDTPLELIKVVQPDILVKGKDYETKDIVGADIVEKKGGKIVTMEFIEGYSTSSIIDKIKNQ